jgi:PEGA domain
MARRAVMWSAAALRSRRIFPADRYPAASTIRQSSLFTRSSPMKHFLALILCPAIFAACATETTIQSIPPGATASIDQRVIGETPVKFSDSSAFWTKRQLILKKDGYEAMHAALRKDQVRVGPLIGAILVLVPVFWILGYPQELTYELQPVEP